MIDRDERKNLARAAALAWGIVTVHNLLGLVRATLSTGSNLWIIMWTCGGCMSILLCLIFLDISRD